MNGWRPDSTGSWSWWYCLTEMDPRKGVICDVICAGVLHANGEIIALFSLLSYSEWLPDHFAPQNWTTVNSLIMHEMKCAHLIQLMMFILYHKMHGLCFTIKLSFTTIAIVDRIWVEQNYPHLACLAFIEFQRKLKYTISSSKTLPQPTTDILVCIYQLLIVFPILLSFCWQHCCCHLG